MLIPRKPKPTRRHIEEQLKLVAGGCQLLALSLSAAGVVAPFFNSALDAPLWIKAIVVSIAFILEGVALTVLRYIPFPDEA